MANQMMLFETEQTQRADGSIVLRARKLVEGREISVRAAANMLGFKDRETIYKLVDIGAITGWKPQSRRGNGKYRIDLASVLDYKARRIADR